MKQKYIAGFVALIAFNAQAESLKNIAEIGLKNDLRIEQLTNSQINSQLEVKQIDSLYDTQVSLTGSANLSIVEENENRDYNDVWSATAGINGSKVLYDTGREPTVNILSETSLLDYYTLKEYEQSVLNNISNIYYNVLRNKKILEVDFENQKSVAKQYDQIKNMVEFGLKTTVELADVQAELDIAESNIVTSENNLQNSLTQLFLYTGNYDLNPDDIVFSDLKKDLEDQGYEYWFAIMESENFSLKKVATQKRIAKHSIELAESEKETKVYLTGGVNSTYNNRAYDNLDNSASVGVSIELPFYSSGSNEIGVLQAQNDYSNAAVNIDYTYRQLNPQLKILLNELNSIDRQIDSLNKVVASTKKSLTATKSSYDAGSKDIVDFLNANTQYYISLKNVANAEYNYLIKQNELRQLVGQLSLENI